jgi:GrpB-like predicted nucleotidyltransferase (UPF0157 family)
VRLPAVARHTLAQRFRVTDNLGIEQHCSMKSVYHWGMPKPTHLTAIQVVDYDPHWPRIFHRFRDQIWPSVRDVAVAIEHVGSTSVPGMAAKPVIDMDVVIATAADLPLLKLRLRSLGYEHRGNLGVDDREAFLSPENLPSHHLYACVQNSLALQNHIAVRDYLRTHASEANVYSTLKKRLAERYPNERERYVEGKTDFLLSILEQCGFSGKGLDSIRHANQI